MSNISTRRPPAVETDPRFPTGPWIGFWLQRLRIRGFGVDVIGRFSMQGTYDLKSGHCSIIKQYDGAHNLQYEGVNGEEMWLWGLWTLPTDRGGFHVWPEGAPDLTRRQAKTAIDRPVRVTVPLAPVWAPRRSIPSPAHHQKGAILA